jgi:hypothetical protein
MLFLSPTPSSTKRTTLPHSLTPFGPDFVQKMPFLPYFWPFLAVFWGNHCHFRYQSPPRSWNSYSPHRVPPSAPHYLTRWRTLDLTLYKKSPFSPIFPNFWPFSAVFWGKPYHFRSQSHPQLRNSYSAHRVPPSAPHYLTHWLTLGLTLYKKCPFYPILDHF